MCNLYWCYAQTAVVWEFQNQVIFQCILLDVESVCFLWDSFNQIQVHRRDVGYCKNNTSSVLSSKNCNGPHTINAANVGSTRDLISRKNVNKDCWLQGWYYMKNVSRHQHDKNRSVNKFSNINNNDNDIYSGNPLALAVFSGALGEIIGPLGVIFEEKLAFKNCNSKIPSCTS